MVKKYIFLLCVLSVSFMPSSIQATQSNEVILFYKPGCPYCTYMNPLFTKLANQNQGKAQFKRIDIRGKDQFYKSKYGFSTVPTVVYLKDGKAISKHGSNNKKIKPDDMQRHMQSF